MIAHSSADPASLVTALVRGAFEYQGQKCSAASRAYLPRSLWDNGLREALVDTTKTVRFGDVTDFSYFGGAVIDAKAFAEHKDLFERVRHEQLVEILAGGSRRRPRRVLRRADHSARLRPLPRDLHDRVLRPHPLRIRLRR